MKMTPKIVAIALVSIALLVRPSHPPAHAHHGFDGAYDASRPLYLEGIVREVRWQSPHSVIVLELPRTLSIPNNFRQSQNINNLGVRVSQTLTVPQNLLGTTQRLEFPPVGSMVNPLRNRLRVGNRVAAIAYRNCEAPHQLRIQFVRLTEGTTVVRPGTVQTEVNGCPRPRSQ